LKKAIDKKEPMVTSICNKGDQKNNCPGYPEKSEIHPEIQNSRCSTPKYDI
jgi:hypothetical protein